MIFFLNYNQQFGNFSFRVMFGEIASVYFLFEK